METRIPNLFSKCNFSECNGERDYNLYLSRLMSGGSPERIIQVCRRIRSYASQGPGVKAALFTYFYELMALCETGKYAVAWRQLLQRDRTLRGAGFDYRSHSWSRKDSNDLQYDYGPLLYLTGRFSEAAAILEKALEFECRGRNGSYDAMYKVANNDLEPSHHCRVTLLHCYRRLGRSLCDWTGWRPFVKRMHPKLYRMAKITRESMLDDPSLLIEFQTRLRRILDERTLGSGGTWGICDLLDSRRRSNNGTLQPSVDSNNFKRAFGRRRNRRNAS